MSFNDRRRNGCLRKIMPFSSNNDEMNKYVCWNFVGTEWIIPLDFWETGRGSRMMKVPPLSLVGMERLPLPLPFSPELLWRFGPPHSSGPPPASSVSAAISRAAAAAAASIPSPLATQLPFAYDIKHTIPLNLGKSSFARYPVNKRGYITNKQFTL